MNRGVEMSLMTLGYAMYYEGYSKEKLDNMKDFEIVMLAHDFEQWVKEEGWKKEKWLR